MNDTTRRAAALKLLETTGIWPSNYAPPALHLLWRMGIDCPLPHFVRFWPVCLVTGISFGVFTGLIMYAMSALSDHQTFSHIPLSAGFAGLLFGPSMAIYYAIGRRKYRLPLWDELHAGADPAQDRQGR